MEASVSNGFRAQMVVVLPDKPLTANISFTGQQLLEPLADYFISAAQPVGVHIVERLFLHINVEVQILLSDMGIASEF